ncbi:MAG: hypothetical protein KUG79_16450 [Pseudomonadales bacterium]|nr:hypothetical protein [Pseudomonadales bacterium]
MHDTLQSNAIKAVDVLYHSWLTGLVLSLLNHKDVATAEEFIFRLFRQQHLERFLPGLVKLGLDKLPDAVASAKYHYYSNQLGGVKVEYYVESDQKAWIRYPPPRWIWQGTAICAIPEQVNTAMLRGWHAHNGISLGNPNMGFVCTKTTTAGQAGLEGYYKEYDRPLAPEERLQFKRDESCPLIAASAMQKLDSETWPALRQAKAAGRYSMEYMRNALPVLIELLGEQEALSIGRICGRQVGMHCYDEIFDLLTCADVDADVDALVGAFVDSGPTTFIHMLAELFIASGDQVEIGSDASQLRRSVWRLFPQSDALLEQIWLAPFEGLLAVHNRFLTLSLANGHFSISSSTQ